jgi:hypothetical protein
MDRGSATTGTMTGAASGARPALARARRRAAPAVLAAVLAAVLPVMGAEAAPGSAAGSPVPDPELTHVPRDAGLHGRPQTDHTVDMGAYGYVEEEYLVSGTARTYDDEPATAAYTTRIIVRRPERHRDFNGTAIVEWNNVTAQHDQTPDWFWARPMVVREGFAYVIVSAQQAGHCCAPLSLQTADPLRYGDLDHPGDAHSFDIFSQVAKAVLAPAGTDPMDGMQVRRVLAAGHSQSAGRLHTYVTDVHPNAGLFDGFLLDGLGSKTFPEPPGVPVIHLLEEWGLDPAEPNQTENYRLWEVAGSAHADYWILRQQFDAPERALPRQPQHRRAWGDAVDENAGNYGYDVAPRQLTCPGGGNLFPKRYAVSAALWQLDRWARTGVPAPQPPRAEFEEDGTVARDEHGNVRGGLRLPPIEVPIATYLGDVCELFGATIPFDPATLHELYPTHEEYVARMRQATDRAVAQGILLPADADDLLRRAVGSSIPVQGVGSPLPPLAEHAGSRTLRAPDAGDLPPLLGPLTGWLPGAR